MEAFSSETFTSPLVGARSARKQAAVMDFVMLALWTRKVREFLRAPATDFAAARVRSNFVLQVAAKIRAEMLAAVRLKRTFRGVVSK